jgi:hypothetical protein
MTCLSPVWRDSTRPLSLPTTDRVWGHRSAHDGLAETPGGVDDRLVATTVGGIGGEQDSGRVGRHHPLHHHRDGDGRGIDGPARSVADCPGRAHRRPAAHDRFSQLGLAVHVEERLQLAREARLGQVLGSGRRAHRHGPPRAGLGHPRRTVELAIPRLRSGGYFPRSSTPAGAPSGRCAAWLPRLRRGRVHPPGPSLARPGAPSRRPRQGDGHRGHQQVSGQPHLRAAGRAVAAWRNRPLDAGPRRGQGLRPKARGTLGHLGPTSARRRRGRGRGDSRGSSWR